MGEEGKDSEGRGRGGRFPFAGGDGPRLCCCVDIGTQLQAHRRLAWSVRRVPKFLAMRRKVGRELLAGRWWIQCFSRSDDVMASAKNSGVLGTGRVFQNGDEAQHVQPINDKLVVIECESSLIFLRRPGFIFNIILEPTPFIMAHN